jgi:hypothetical protein
MKNILTFILLFSGTDLFASSCKKKCVDLNRDTCSPKVLLKCQKKKCHIESPRGGLWGFFTRNKDQHRTEQIKKRMNQCQQLLVFSQKMPTLLNKVNELLRVVHPGLYDAQDFSIYAPSEALVFSKVLLQAQKDLFRLQGNFLALNTDGASGMPVVSAHSQKDLDQINFWNKHVEDIATKIIATQNSDVFQNKIELHRTMLGVMGKQLTFLRSPAEVIFEERSENGPGVSKDMFPPAELID